jgi:hypothetical protein
MVLWPAWNFKEYRAKGLHLAGETQKVPAQRMIDFTKA